MSKGMIDNKQRGLVGDVLKKHMQKGSKLSVAAAHFTLYAFVGLFNILLYTNVRK